jgi:hypothetical protein
MTPVSSSLAVVLSCPERDSSSVEASSLNVFANCCFVSSVQAFFSRSARSAAWAVASR